MAYIAGTNLKCQLFGEAEFKERFVVFKPVFRSVRYHPKLTFSVCMYVLYVYFNEWRAPVRFDFVWMVCMYVCMYICIYVYMYTFMNGGPVLV